MPTARKKRVVVKGIEHGLGGYTNHHCRCHTCTEANAEHSREYRNRRFAGAPLCAVEGCQAVQSRSYGNSLCYNHARAALELQARLPTMLRRMNRLQLKRFIRDNGLPVRVLKRYTDADVRKAILASATPVDLARAA